MTEAELGQTFRVYSASYCGYCRAAIGLLKARDYPLEVIDVTTDWDLRAELKRLTGQHTVPQIFRGERHVGGYEELVRHLAEEARG